VQPSNLTLETLLAEITTLRQELTDQRREVTNLKAQLAQTTPTPSQPPTLNPSRRRAIARVAALALGGVAAATLAAPADLEAKIIINPSGQNNRIGAIIQPPGAATPTNSPGNSARIGLVASPDSSLDLSGLNGASPIGVYGYAPTGVGVVGDGPFIIGVQGTSAAGTGVAGTGGSNGVSGSSTNGLGVFGITGNGTGVRGNSYNNGIGVSGTANTGTGVSATSSTGAPLHITPGNQPTYGGTGSPSQGDMYMDTSGNLHIYDGTSWKLVVVQ
jgi:hypothetical protein